MYDGPSQHSPERELWQAVLLQVIGDAFESPSGIGKAVTRERVKREALEYLTRPSEDLAMLCSLAGVDMGALMGWMKKRAKVTVGLTILQDSAVQATDPM